MANITKAGGILLPGRRKLSRKAKMVGNVGRLARSMRRALLSEGEVEPLEELPRIKAIEGLVVSEGDESLQRENFEASREDFKRPGTQEEIQEEALQEKLSKRPSFFYRGWRGGEGVHSRSMQEVLNLYKIYVHMGL